MTPVASLPAAGRALDALIAEQVFGWDLSPQKAHDWGPDSDSSDHHTGKTCSWCGRYEPTCGCRIDPDEPCTRYIPGYSTNLEAAWQLVEKMPAMPGHVGRPMLHLLRACANGHWEAQFCSDFGYTEIARGVTAPHAICLAALVAALKAVAP